MILSPKVGVNQYTGILKVKQMHTQKKEKKKKKKDLYKTKRLWQSLL
jgi:hypothetical protein